MRIIGHVPNEQTAALFSNFLVVKGIANEVEADREGWAVWIHSEDELERSRGLLDKFLANPSDPAYRQHSRQAESIKKTQEQEEVVAAKRHFDRRRLFRRMTPYGSGPLTFSLILVCVVVSVFSKLGHDREFLSFLLISASPQGLPEVARGEVWRLLTPILVHFGLLHLAFNMLWLFDLGSMIESRLGTAKFALLVVALGVVPNVGQFLVSGPHFGGMSGVVYGLLGYVWMKGKFDPQSGLFLHPQTVTLMLIWFFLCLFGVMGNIANTVHAIGLILGFVWGYLSSQHFAHRG